MKSKRSSFPSPAKSALLFLGVFVTLLIISNPCDAMDQEIPEVIQKYMSKMSLEEKIGQMSQIDIAMLLVSDEDDMNANDDDEGSVEENNNSTNAPREEKARLSKSKVEHYIGKLGIGSVLNLVVSWDVTDYRKAVTMLQDVTQKYGRPPVIWGLDSVHGANYIRNAIITPQPINIAATFNASVAQLAGKMASRDTRAAGINWLFSPLLGITYDSSRWARVYETFGEDPIVVQEMAKAMIRGIQQPAQTQSEIPSRAAACGKHYVGYSYPHNGHDRSPSWIPIRHLYQYFVPVWKNVLLNNDAALNSTASASNLMTIMESYTEVDGVPNVGNKQTLQYLLRQQLQFHDGVLVTDYEEIKNMNSWHHVTDSDVDSVINAMKEGTVDMSMIPFDYNSFHDGIVNGLNDGQLSQYRVDKSTLRVLKLKYDLNLFDEIVTMDNNPNVQRILDNGKGDNKDNEDVRNALNMAHQSIVLVKNQGEMLPIKSKESMSVETSEHSTTNILITGPTSNSLDYQSGGWTGNWQGTTEFSGGWFNPKTSSTIFSAFKKEAKDNGWNVQYVCGVDILGEDCTPHIYGDKAEEGIQQQKSHDNGNALNSAIDWFQEWTGMKSDENSSNHVSYEVVVDLLQKKKQDQDEFDYIIVGLGEESYAEKPGDIRSLDLPFGQYELIRLIKNKIFELELKAKIICVYMGGRPRLLSEIVEYVDAVLVGFLPGPNTGKAIYDIITGKVNPSGQLPLTYPMYDDGGGVPYYHTISDQCTRDTNEPLPHYEYIPCPVQWPFGHGLSYSLFEYSNLQISTKKLTYKPFLESSNEEDSITISLTVKNNGLVDGSHAILFFTFDKSREVTPEFKRLRGFEKIFFEAKQTKTVSITLPVSEFKFVGAHDNTHYIMQDGLSFQFGVGPYVDCRRMTSTSSITGSTTSASTSSGSNHGAHQQELLLSDPEKLCSEEITISTSDHNHIAACEAACEVWERSGCNVYDNSKHCYQSCSEAGKEKDKKGPIRSEDGWGWNYVQCIESVVWGFQQEQEFHQNEIAFYRTFESQRKNSYHDQCWKMTSLCRDVVSTPPDIDEYGYGGEHYNPGTQNRQGTVPGTGARIVALLVGLFSFGFIIYLIRGGKGPFQDSSGDVQFQRLSTAPETDLTA